MQKVTTIRNVLQVLVSLIVLFYIGLREVQAQDTLYFRDNSFAIARLKSAGFRKISYLLLTESGDSLLKTEKSVRLDSIHFRNGSVYHRGRSFFGTGLPEISAYASYWEGVQAGRLCPSFNKSQIAWNYLAGIGIFGLPITLHQALRRPREKELSDRESLRIQMDSAYAKGFRKGMNQTRLTALLPVYLAGTVSSMLGLAVFFPRDVF
jgi:hypothetical protein